MQDYYPEYTNLLQAFTAFLCGSMIVSSLFVAFSTENEFITLLALMLTTTGVLLLIDILVPFNKMLHFFTVLFALVLGGVTSFIIHWKWNSLYYLLIVLVFTGLIYLSRFFKKKK